MATNEDFLKRSGLDKLFETALKEIFWSETHLANVLNSMANAASSEALQEAFRQHQAETMVHGERLGRVFELMELPPETKHSKGLQGLFDEGWQVIDETQDGTAQRDAALIMAAQKVEHFEISCYGSLVTLAKTLGKNEVAALLHSTLEEEKSTDEKLTTLAEAGINDDAAEERLSNLSSETSDATDKPEPEEVEREAPLV